MQTAIASMTVKDKITKHWDTFGSHCTSNEIDTMVTERGYKCLYLPLYSPELNPIEQLWSIVKNKVERSQFQTKENLATRITEACNNIPPKHLRAFVQHSVNIFEDCLKGNPI